MQSEKTFKMMPGSTTGMTYLHIGQNGNMGLGMKPGPIMQGDAVGAPGHTYVTGKLRVAPVESEAIAGAVVSLKDAKKFDMPSAAYPEIKWEKDAEERASTTFGTLLVGDLSSIAGMQSILDQVKDGQLSSKVADYMVQVLGDALKLPREDLVEWLELAYSTFASRLAQSIAMTEAQSEAAKEQVGTFAMHTDMVKKVYDKLGQSED